MLLADAELLASSATLKLMMPTILDTSFFTLSGSEAGRGLPTSFRLQRYIAKANSGKCSSPDRVVSASVLYEKKKR